MLLLKPFFRVENNCIERKPHTILSILILLGGDKNLFGNRPLWIIVLSPFRSKNFSNIFNYRKSFPRINRKLFEALVMIFVISAWFLYLHAGIILCILLCHCVCVFSRPSDEKDPTTCSTKLNFCRIYLQASDQRFFKCQYEK